MPEGATPPTTEVTLGEVYRAVLEVRAEQREMRKDVIGRAEYESDQEGHVNAHKELAKQITEARVEHASRVDGLVRTFRWIAGVAAALFGTVLAVVLPHLRWG